MSAKTDLMDGITKSEQKLKTLKADVEEDKKVVQDEADKQKRELDRALRVAEQEVINLKERKESKEALYDAKIEAIDAALKQLEEIKALNFAAKNELSLTHDQITERGNEYAALKQELYNIQQELIGSQQSQLLLQQELPLLREAKQAVETMIATRLMRV